MKKIGILTLLMFSLCSFAKDCTVYDPDTTVDGSVVAYGIRNNLASVLKEKGYKVVVISSAEKNNISHPYNKKGAKAIGYYPANTRQVYSPPLFNCNYKVYLSERVKVREKSHPYDYLKNWKNVTEFETSKDATVCMQVYNDLKKNIPNCK